MKEKTASTYQDSAQSSFLFVINMDCMKAEIQMRRHFACCLQVMRRFMGTTEKR